MLHPRVCTLECMTTAVRVNHVLGSRQGLATLQQRFRFDGEGAHAATIVRILLSARLTGDDSVFGARPGEEGPRTESSRTLRRFSPAPGFRFDVHLSLQDVGVFLVRFSQPEREVPYLEGDLVWTVVDEGAGAVLDEQINTEQAFHTAREPLRGPRPSLRRWLFFRAGHKRVMSLATNNIAVLLDASRAI